MKFVKNTKYYGEPVWEWNLPTGTTCPFALECRVSVDRNTGKFDINRGAYRCYAAGPERFPGVREHRWKNFDFVRAGGVPVLPHGCRAVRIHAAGDFFNQAYFDTWLKVAKENPGVEFWAYTKSIRYWVERLGRIPKNLVLTASYGGREDHLIEKHGLKNVRVYSSAELVPDGRPIDTNDSYARQGGINFALVDNYAGQKKTTVKQLDKQF
jgi:hypothetical protein